MRHTLKGANILSDVYLYKKVQLLCADFARRFGPADPLRFAFRDLAAFTVFSGMV